MIRKRIKRILEAKAVLGCPLEAALIQAVEQRFVTTGRLLVIQACQTGTGNGGAAQVIAVLALRLQVSFNITQALPSAQLCKCHGNKLRPAAGLAQPLALVMQRSDRFKTISGSQS